MSPAAALFLCLVYCRLIVDCVVCRINAYGRGPGFEPGAFGGAWTLATSVQFAARGVSRVFHWGVADAAKLDSAGHSLYWANGWVMAAARKIGCMAANVSVLTTAVSDTLAQQSYGASAPTGDVCANTTASGIGGPLSNSTGGVGLLIAVFSQRKDCSNRTTVSVTFQCPASKSPARVQLMVLNETTSVYGQIHRHARNEGWLSFPDDGEIYPLLGPAVSMLTPAGLAGVKASAPHWLEMQRQLFTMRDLDGEGDNVRVVRNGGGDGVCALEFRASPPAVIALRVEFSEQDREGVISKAV